ncbi:MAG: hypothetical protein ACKOYG_05755 [Ilumatobacteraceae bacterium]
MEDALAPVDEMYLEGLDMKRAQIRRAHPDADDDLVERLLASWILDRPLDAPGRIRPA